jgi:hypothetical protein
MEELMQELSSFSVDSRKEELENWAQDAEAEIDQMNEKEGNIYYLMLSEFHAVYLRDIETGYEMLKKVRQRLPVIA